MIGISFEEKVRSIDWTKYLEPEYYDPEKMYYIPDKTISALIKLSQYDEDESNAEFCSGIGSEVRFAKGNDHRGTYYPAALEAIDLIIEIEKHSEIEAARKCAYYILNDWYYFQLEIGNDDKQLYVAIESNIKEKLRPYADEHITNK
jgi:hypothetical protein